MKVSNSKAHNNTSLSCSHTTRATHIQFNFYNIHKLQAKKDTREKKINTPANTHSHTPARTHKAGRSQFPFNLPSIHTNTQTNTCCVLELRYNLYELYKVTKLIWEKPDVLQYIYWHTHENTHNSLSATLSVFSSTKNNSTVTETERGETDTAKRYVQRKESTIHSCMVNFAAMSALQNKTNPTLHHLHRFYNSFWHTHSPFMIHLFEWNFSVGFAICFNFFRCISIWFQYSKSPT